MGLSLRIKLAFATLHRTPPHSKCCELSGFNRNRMQPRPLPVIHLARIGKHPLGPRRPPPGRSPTPSAWRREAAEDGDIAAHRPRHPTARKTSPPASLRCVGLSLHGRDLIACRSIAVPNEHVKRLIRFARIRQAADGLSQRIECFIWSGHRDLPCKESLTPVHARADGGRRSGHHRRAAARRRQCRAADW